MLPLVLMAGGSCSGKSTLAWQVAEAMTGVEVTTCSIDNYYKDLSNLTPAEIDEYNFDCPEALDDVRLIADAKRLLNGKKVKMPVYNFVTHRQVDLRKIIPGDIIILEGLLALHYIRLVELSQVRIFVACSADIRQTRRINRDVTQRGRTVDQVLKQCAKTVEPMYKRFVMPSIARADLVVPGDNLDLAVERVKSLLQSKLSLGAMQPGSTVF